MAKTSRDSFKFMLRLPDELRDRLRIAAVESGRSMTAEIIAKLERYDSLGGEADAMWEVARALASQIDRVCDGSMPPLEEKISDAFEAVDDTGNFDHAKLGREYSAEASDRLEKALSGAVRIPSDLLGRIRDKASKNVRSIDAEIISVLEREFPAGISLGEFIERWGHPAAAAPRAERERLVAEANNDPAAKKAGYSLGFQTGSDGWDMINVVQTQGGKSRVVASLGIFPAVPTE